MTSRLTTLTQKAGLSFTRRRLQALDGTSCALRRALHFDYESSIDRPVHAGVIGWSVAFLLAGCAGDDDDNTITCTTEIRSAILGDISSPEGLPIDSVTAERSFVAECEGDFSSAAQDAAQGPLEFYCWEQGGNGTYVVRVTSGDLTWTQSATVERNECHTTRTARLHFVLDPDTAD